MSLSKWLNGKAYTAIIVSVFFYLAGSALGIIPQPVKDFTGWLDRNTSMLLVTLCFLVACFVILKVKRRRDEST